MTWTTPANVSDGVASSSQFNDEVVANLLHLHGAWTDYTPTYTNFSLGNGTVNYARYRSGDGMVTVEVQITLGSTSSITGNMSVSLPVSAANSNQPGSLRIRDFGTRTYVGLATSTGSSVLLEHSESGNGGIVNATSPITFAATDTISFSITYEAA